jgi:type IV secretory pathway TrbL component
LIQAILPEMGGARGEMARGISEDKMSGTPGLSSRSETGATTNNKEALAIAEVVALQTGQRCDEQSGAALRSAQE